MNIKKLLFPFLPLLAVTTIAGQPLKFEHLGIGDGLSQNSVTSIGQDSIGFMWFGTSFGLNRYDSHGFKYYKSNPHDDKSLSYNYITCILADSKNTLWIGTKDGLNRYLPVQDCFERIKANKTNNESISNNFINCIYKDKKENIWVGTENGLNLLTNRKTLTFKTFNTANTNGGLKNNSIYAILEDFEGNIWVGTDGGLTRISVSGNKYTYFTLQHNPSDPRSLCDNKIHCLSEDKSGNLWIGTLEKGVDKYNLKTKTFTNYNSSTQGNRILNNNVRSFLIDNQDKLWIGTLSGISILNLSDNQILDYQNDPDNNKSLSKNSIYALFKDRTNDIYVGVFYGGVNYTSYNKPSFKVYKKNTHASSLSYDVVSCFLEDNNYLWVGTEGGGANLFDRKTKTFKYFSHNNSNAKSIGSNLVKIIYGDSEGNIWLGTHGGGISLYNRKSNNFTNYLYDDSSLSSMALEVQSIVEGSSNSLLLGTTNGLKIYQKEVKPNHQIGLTFVKDFLHSVEIHALIKDKAQNVWVGADNGLYFKPTNQTKLIPINLKANEEVNIRGLSMDNTGNLWIAAFFSGLICYDTRNGNVTRYTKKDGLPSDDVVSVSIDKDGNIWAGTNNGLSKFKSQEKEFITYSKEDGLAGNEFNSNASLFTKNGEMFFGGVDGFTSFFPKDIPLNKTKPSTIFTGMSVFNEPIEIGIPNKILSSNICFAPKITLKYNQSLFTFNFATLSYDRSEKNKYAYKIDDNPWNQTDIPSATFTNLPPGKYTLWAKGSNGDQLWSDPIYITFRILPPWWESWWAYSIYLLLFASIFFLFARFLYLRALLKKESALTNLKLNFFTNISHEIHTYLALIIGPVEKLLSTKKETDADVSKLTMIKKNSTDLLHLVNELLDFRKIETGNLPLHVAEYDLVPFVLSIFQSFKEISSSKNIVSDLIHTSDVINLFFDKEQMKKVIFNLLSNAYKFTQAGGYVSVIIDDKNESYVSIQVRDNGKGISSENLDKLFDNFFQENDFGIQNTGYGIGLSLSKSIVSLHSGKIVVKSNQTAKEPITIFDVTLLRGNSHFKKEQFIATGTAISDENILHQVSTSFLKGLDELGTDKIRYSLLIIDDNPEIRKFIADSFQNSYQILQAENGLRGFEIAVECIPDIIISDVMMPVMDGYTLCEKIKKDERTNHIPVIVLTAKSTLENQMTGYTAGADIYVNKPFSIQLLELQVKNLIRSRESLRKLYYQQMMHDSIANITTLNPLENPQAEHLKTNNQITENEFINKVVIMIEENISNKNLDVEMICKKLHFSQTVLYKKIKSITGMTIHEIVKNIRLKKAAELISTKEYTVYEIADMIGYSDTKYFSSEFKKKFGVSPRDYK